MAVLTKSGTVDVTVGSLQIKQDASGLGWIVTQNGNEIHDVLKVTIEIGVEQLAIAKIEVIA